MSVTSSKVDLSLIDLDEVRRRALHNHQWDGGCALFAPTPPDIVIALIDEVRRLRTELQGAR